MNRTAVAIVAIVEPGSDVVVAVAAVAAVVVHDSKGGLHIGL